MPGPLLNHVALVTGSGKRLGRAVALGLAVRGADVVVHYRSSEQEALAVVAEIEKLGRRSIALQADLASTSGIQQLFQQVESRFGRLDILVNSAANFIQTEFAATTDELWDGSLDTNLKAPFFCSQAAAPLLKKTSGAIINFADIGGILGWPGFIPHSISKAGVIMLTRCLAKERHRPGHHYHARRPPGVGIRLHAVSSTAPQWKARRHRVRRPLPCHCEVRNRHGPRGGRRPHAVTPGIRQIAAKGICRSGNLPPHPSVQTSALRCILMCL
jgi:NAD(P)-dependent dehydrogenase (short-subunit alcohol dehydrogenase family)